MFWETLHNSSFPNLGTALFLEIARELHAYFYYGVSQITLALSKWISVVMYVNNSAVCLLDAMKYTNYLTCTVSFYPPNYIVRKTLLSTPFYSWQNWCSEGLSNLSKDTQLGSGW